MARPPVDHERGGLHGLGAEPVQGFLAGLRKPGAPMVRNVSASRPGLIGLVPPVRFLAFHELHQPAIRLSHRRVGIPKAGATCFGGEFIELGGFLDENFNLAH